MGAAFLGVNTIGERKYRLGEGVVVLYRHLDQSVVQCFLVVKGRVLHDPAVSVDVTHQVGYAAVEVVAAFDVAAALLFVPVAGKPYLQPFIQESDLFEVGGENIEVILDYRKNFRVGPERHGSTVFLGFLSLYQATQGYTLGVLLEVNPSFPPYLSFEILGKTVDHGAAHPVKPSGHLVGSTTELPAGMQRSHNRL